MWGNLYIIATPIGNLEDLTFRALEIIRNVDLLYAEDTRRTIVLLKHYGIKRSILSYYAHSSEKKKKQILENILAGRNVGLVTESGTPGVSDPGNELIGYILRANSQIKVIPIPGASAITALISVAGWDLSKFLFIGFFPKKKKTKIFELARNFEIPIIFYESPFRIIKTLEFIKLSFGSETCIVLGRELTKKFEEIIRGNVCEVLERLNSGKRVKGEVTVIVKFSKSLVNFCNDSAAGRI
ncbi:MAG: 16S rRNA (cytidine(1402)-2'-O)-methyltransferase [Patescibacteria group bacterium]|nr:16S rRNA (cytidine(1402)-2'-O)-methyltransferase [Patescibacteria group bacterium]